MQPGVHPETEQAVVCPNCGYKFIVWTHAVEPEDGHPVDPHYQADGKWTCYKCREPIKQA